MPFKRKMFVSGSLVIVLSLFVVTAAYKLTLPGQQPTASKPVHVTVTRSVTAAPSPTLTPTLSPSPTSTVLPAPNPAAVLGLDSNPGRYFAGISWIRLAYPSCGFGSLSGQQLQSTIQNYHNDGLRVLLIVCQPAPSGAKLFDPQQFIDIKQSGADAVQCGNEEMKSGPFNSYVTPSDFARFFDLCTRAVRAVQPNVPVILGALDPQVGGSYYQVSYLNQMQYAMNTQVHPGGNWSWRSQIVGLIDSWHNGYPGQYVNNLYALFSFWATQFGVSLNNGDLGRHLWVVEGTGCFKGCGINQYSAYQVAVSHILTLVTDVQTAMRYKVPFFYFSDWDFQLDGVYWPIGIMDREGRAKPIRQDLSMGARVLVMSCATGQVKAVNQEQLLATMYQGCALPSNYLGVLEG